MQIHLKMMIGDYVTYQVKSEQSGGQPHCRLGCKDQKDQHIVESICHIIAECCATQEIREQIKSELSILLQHIHIDTTIIFQDNQIFTQFILDPTSMNLSLRVNINDPVLPQILKLSRDLCASINKKRMNLLQNLIKNH